MPDTTILDDNAVAEIDCTCKDLTDVQRAHGEHYDDCPCSSWISDRQISELEELARKRPNQSAVWRVPALCATVRAAWAIRDQLSAALSVRDAQLAAVTQERDRLLRGDFTSEEFQNLCHNKDVQSGFEVFADGCETYQQKLFGRCRKGTTI